MSLNSDHQFLHFAKLTLYFPQ